LPEGENGGQGRALTCLLSPFHHADEAAQTQGVAMPISTIGRGLASHGRCVFGVVVLESTGGVVGFLLKFVNA